VRWWSEEDWGGGRSIRIFGAARGGASLKIQGGACIIIYASNYYVRGGASLYMQVIKGAAQVRVRSDVTRAGSGK
jgi:hypothetical protein